MSSQVSNPHRYGQNNQRVGFLRWVAKVSNPHRYGQNRRSAGPWESGDIGFQTLIGTVKTGNDYCSLCGFVRTPCPTPSRGRFQTLIGTVKTLNIRYSTRASHEALIPVFKNPCGRVGKARPPEP